MTSRRAVLKTTLGGVVASLATGAEATVPPPFVFSAPPVVTLPIIGNDKRFPVRRIYCVGRNYLAHRRELGNSEVDPLFFFAKHRDMIVQHGATCTYPALTKDYQHEVELVVVMKSGGLDIPVDRALDHVYGYAVGLDMTRRDQQAAMKSKQLPWEVAKSFEDSAPCGAITPASASGHLKNARINLRVNDTVRQDSDIANMMWSVAEVIHQLSQQVAIEAGDLIYSGTPEGVGAVARGDRLTAHIDGLSELVIGIA